MQTTRKIKARNIDEDDDFLRRSIRWMDAELRFAVYKFLKLPAEERKEIYKQLNSGNGGQFDLAAEKLIGFIDKNPKEMAEFIAGGMSIPEWKIQDSEKEIKTKYIGVYFKKYLSEEGTMQKIIWLYSQLI